MYKNHYSSFLKATEGKLYLTAHSHHFWPDVTLEAQQQYWLDSARLVDDKWSYFFESIIPETQSLIAEQLNISHPNQIAFASNTHEFINRLYSCLKPQAKVLSSDSEFYSFSRQTMRLEEEGLIVWEQLPAQPYQSLAERFIDKIKNFQYDMIFFSRVFFNSGVVLNGLHEILKTIEQYQSSDCIVVIDDYHGFMAIPLNFRPFEHRAFYLAGSYKYAGAGEGCCFLISPKNNRLRPINTGWFANFECLSNFSNYKISYSDNGYRFCGATQDYTSLYRLRSVLLWLKQNSITTHDIHMYVQSLQQSFIELIRQNIVPELSEKQLLLADFKSHGHFFTFELENEIKTQALHLKLKKNCIYTDYRNNRIRFGFGLYHDHNDIKNYFAKLK